MVGGGAGAGAGALPPPEDPLELVLLEVVELEPPDEGA